MTSGDYPMITSGGPKKGLALFLNCIVPEYLQNTLNVVPLLRQILSHKFH